MITTQRTYKSTQRHTHEAVRGRTNSYLSAPESCDPALVQRLSGGGAAHVSVFRIFRLSFTTPTPYVQDDRACLHRRVCALCRTYRAPLQLDLPTADASRYVALTLTSVHRPSWKTAIACTWDRPQASGWSSMCARIASSSEVGRAALRARRPFLQPTPAPAHRHRCASSRCVEESELEAMGRRLGVVLLQHLAQTHLRLRDTVQGVGG